MAITFSRQLSTTDIIYSYNNNIVEFESDSVLTPVRCEVTIWGNVFEIHPDPNGVFSFNFKNVMRTIINENIFKDNIHPNSQTTIKYDDADLYKYTNVAYKIVFEDTTTDSINVAYNFIKAVEQLEDIKENKSNNKSQCILTPFEGNQTGIYYTNFWQGLPFDVAFYSDSVQNITVENVNTAETFTFTSIKGVQRVFFCNGNDYAPLTSTFFEADKVNQVLFKIGTTTVCTLYVKHSSSNCGEYLKFFNRQGGWNYYLFQPNQVNRSINSIGSFNNDNETLENTDSPIIEIGKEAEDVISMYATDIEKYEKSIINEVFSSPKIYRLISTQLNADNNWISEIVTDSEINVEDAKRVKNDVVVVGLIKTKPKLMNIE